MIIEVTAKDIKGANPCLPTDCPVARAARRITKEHCSVSDTMLYVAIRNLNYTIYKLPKIETKRIADFDYGKGMKPHKFRAIKVKR